MSKVRLYGNTSGYVDLQAPDVAGDVTITLPNESGPFATEAYADAAGIAGSGLVAVKHVVKTDTQSSSGLTNGASIAISGLSITHEVEDPSNRLLFSVTLGAVASNSRFGGVGLAIFDGSAFLSIGDSEGSRTRVTSGTNINLRDDANENFSQTLTAEIIHTPGSGSKTYSIYIFNVGGGTRTLYVNRGQVDTDAVAFARTVSTFTLKEVKV